jgi:CRISPR-associated protein Cas1
VLAAGYAPAIGFLNSRKPQSFVYDIADILKFETVVPEAFRVASAVQHNRTLEGHQIGDPVAEVRRRCRDAFRRTNVLARLIPLIEEVLAAGGATLPDMPPEAMPIAFDGHRSWAMLVVVVENAPPRLRGRRRFGCWRSGLWFTSARTADVFGR